MRIGMILDKTFPPDPRVQNEAMALLKNGHEVLLFCLHYGDQIAYEKMEGLGNISVQIKPFTLQNFSLSLYHTGLHPDHGKKDQGFFKKVPCRSHTCT